MNAMIARANEALQHLIPIHLFGKLGQRLRLGGRRRQVERPVETDRLRYGLRDQRLQRRQPKRRQHGAHIIGMRADMAVDKRGLSFGHLPVPYSIGPKIGIDFRKARCADSNS
jgi:hypothetical protein